MVIHVAITWESRDYESSLFIESSLTRSHTLHSLSTSYTFCKVTLYIFTFSQNILNKLENWLKLKDKAHRALQLCCTAYLNLRVASS